MHGRGKFEKEFDGSADDFANIGDGKKQKETEREKEAEIV